MVLTSEILSKASTPGFEEDSDLIQAFLDGDERAFNSLVHKYRRQVYSLAWRYTQNHEEADDLTQETFVKAYQNLATFRKDASFKTWLLRITTNLSINQQKSGRVRKDSGGEVEEQLSTFDPSALTQILDNERRRDLHQAIAQLPPKQKETLLLKTFRDLTCEEVAGVMQCSVGTVKANVFNALKKLKAILSEGVGS